MHIPFKPEQPEPEEQPAPDDEAAAAARAYADDLDALVDRLRAQGDEEAVAHLLSVRDQHIEEVAKATPERPRPALAASDFESLAATMPPYFRKRLQAGLAEFADMLKGEPAVASMPELSRLADGLSANVATLENLARVERDRAADQSRNEEGDDGE